MSYLSAVLNHNPVVFLHDVVSNEWVNESTVAGAVNASLVNSPTVLTSDLPGTNIPAAIRTSKSSSQGARVAHYAALHDPQTSITIGVWKRVSTAQSEDGSDIPTMIAKGDTTYQLRLTSGAEFETKDGTRFTARSGTNLGIDATFDVTDVFTQWVFEVWTWSATDNFNVYIFRPDDTVLTPTLTVDEAQETPDLGSNPSADLTVSFQDNDGVDRRFTSGDFAGLFITQDALSQAQLQVIFDAAFDDEVNDGEISGTYQLEDGTPVADADVYAVRIDTQGSETVAATSTDANGDYGFTGLAAGTYSVHVIDPSNTGSDDRPFATQAETVVVT